MKLQSSSGPLMRDEEERLVIEVWIEINGVRTSVCECDPDDLGAVIESLDFYGVVDEDGTSYDDVEGYGYVVTKTNVVFLIVMGNHDA
jgi:hypothetical protein